MDLFHLWRKAGLNSNHKFLELNWLELIVIEMIIKMSAIAVALLSGQASTPEWEGAVEPSRHAGVGGRAKQARRSGRVLSSQASMPEWEGAVEPSKQARVGAVEPSKYELRDRR